jgi:RNA polymerase sigma-70 factor (ECF subfamily)
MADGPIDRLLELVGSAEDASAGKIENDLYQRWLESGDNDKTEILETLFKLVLKQAKAVVRLKVPEAPPNLAREIASEVIQRLPEFRQESLFSTWAHRIAINKANLEIRRKVEMRGRFVKYEECEQDADLAVENAADILDREILLDQIKRELNPVDSALIDYKLDGLSTKAAAERLGVSEDAAESRLRRLMNDLKKTFTRPDGK